MLKKSDRLIHLPAMREVVPKVGKLHSPADMLFIAMCAVFCNHEHWEDMHFFAKAREAWFKQYIPLENGVPSAAAFFRFFSLLQPSRFKKIFTQLVLPHYDLSQPQLARIKLPNLNIGESNPCLDDIRLYASAYGLGFVADWGERNVKSIIAELLTELNLQACTTAMHGNYADPGLMNRVLEQKSDYLVYLQIKRQGLCEEIQSELRKTRCYGTGRSVNWMTPDYYVTLERGYGGVEVRNCWVSSDLGEFKHAENWPNLNTIGLVRADTYIAEKLTKERYCFASSVAMSERKFDCIMEYDWLFSQYKGWQMHAMFEKTQMRQRADRASQNLSVLRDMILRTLHLDPLRVLIRTKRRRAELSNVFLLKMVSQLLSAL